jgi:hypothetical protein
MTLQTLKIGRREFVVIDKRDFQRLAAKAELNAEDDYWTESALRAEADARAKREKPIPLEEVEREIGARRSGKSAKRGRRV